MPCRSPAIHFRARLDRLAHSRALSLRDWLDQGGFGPGLRTRGDPPEQDTPRPDPDRHYTDAEADNIEKSLGFNPGGPSQTAVGLLSLWGYSYTATRVWREAEEAAHRQFKGKTVGLNDKEDAFRHAYASFVLSQRTSDVFAKAAGDSHERSYANPHNERVMDLFNNHIGRMLAGDPANANRSPVEAIQEALDKGLLMTEPLKIDGGNLMMIGKYHGYKKWKWPN
jgi:hypothetical protein